MPEDEHEVGERFAVFAKSVNDSILKLQAGSIIDKLIIKYLIAEFAADGRSVSQANAMVANLRAKAELFLSDLGEGETENDTTARDTMRSEIDVIFRGIVFRDIQK